MPQLKTRWASQPPPSKGNGRRHRHRNRHRTQRPEVAVGRRKMPVKSRIRVRARHERTARKETTITRTRRLLSCFSCQLVSVAAVQSSGQHRRDSQTPGVQCRKYIYLIAALLSNQNTAEDGDFVQLRIRILNVSWVYPIRYTFSIRNTRKHLQRGTWKLHILNI